MRAESHASCGVVCIDGAVEADGASFKQIGKADAARGVVGSNCDHEPLVSRSKFLTAALTTFVDDVPAQMVFFVSREDWSGVDGREIGREVVGFVGRQIEGQGRLNELEMDVGLHVASFGEGAVVGVSGFLLQRVRF